MAVDFPRAWEICRSVPREYHHNECSYNQQLLLCDCDVVNKHAEAQNTKLLYGAGGQVLKVIQEQEHPNDH